MSDTDRVKSKALIHSSDSDSDDMSDSEFQNVAKKPKLDPAATASKVRLLKFQIIVVTE